MTSIKNPFKEMYWQELKHGYNLSFRQKAILLWVWIGRKLGFKKSI